MSARAFSTFFIRFFRFLRLNEKKKQKNNRPKSKQTETNCEDIAAMHRLGFWLAEKVNETWQPLAAKSNSQMIIKKWTNFIHTALSLRCDLRCDEEDGGVRHHRWSSSTICWLFAAWKFWEKKSTAICEQILCCRFSCNDVADDHRIYQEGTQRKKNSECRTTFPANTAIAGAERERRFELAEKKNRKKFDRPKNNVHANIVKTGLA